MKRRVLARHWFALIELPSFLPIKNRLGLLQQQLYIHLEKTSPMILNKITTYKTTHIKKLIEKFRHWLLKRNQLIPNKSIKNFEPAIEILLL